MLPRRLPPALRRLSWRSMPRCPSDLHGYGYQCLLCLYRLSFDGAYLAVCADRSALGRSDIYSPYCDQCPRKDRLFLAAEYSKGDRCRYGLFIAFIGLQNAGISVKNDATLVALGQIFQPSVLLVIVGLISTAVLLVKNIPGALLIGIAITTNLRHTIRPDPFRRLCLYSAFC